MPLGSVLVLQHCRQTIAVMRSLSRAGYRVILGASNARAPAEFSRHCHEVWRHPPFDDLPVFERALMSFLDSRPDIQDTVSCR